MSKDIFYFNRQDRIATAVLLAVILVTQAVQMNMPAPVRDDSAAVPDSMKLAWTDVHRDTAYRRSGPVTYRRNDAGRRVAAKPAVSGPGQDTLTDTAFVPRYRVKSRPSAKTDLNAADSLLLTGLPGIGPWTAHRILQYRNSLGGFVSQDQLLEIEGLPDSLLQWFIVADTVSVTRIKVNSAGVSELRRHPYLNFYQARAIVELRRDRGKVQGPGQLSLLEEFTERDLERLEPYLDYE